MMGIILTHIHQDLILIPVVDKSLNRHDKRQHITQYEKKKQRELLYYSQPLHKAARLTPIPPPQILFVCFKSTQQKHKPQSN